MWCDSALAGLPDLLGEAKTPSEWEQRRVKLLDLLHCEEYGYPAKLSLDKACINAESKGDGYRMQSVTLDIKAEHGCHAVELYTTIPDTAGSHPAFVYISFEPPGEELIKLVTGSGFVLCTFIYKNVTSDDGDMTTGLSGAVYGDKVKTPADRAPDGCGKIMLWALTACIAAEWLSGRLYVDAGRIAVIGHSRLGKTALVAGAMSERFAYVISNESGCSGDAITRGKRGEHVADITRVFPYWFCNNYAKYAGREDEMPFDQHFLIALSAPRKVIVGAAAEDIWADPVASYLGCVAASPAWKIYGGQGVEIIDRAPQPGDVLHSGEIGYHQRAGEHKLKIEDWKQYISYIRRHG
jgi:hypothetical protein